MKTIGLLGGMSWESTVHYYQIINEEVKNKLGGLHSARIILYSVEFAEIENYQSSNQWEKCGEILGRAAKKLEDAGADFILICSNTIHKVTSQIASMLQIPVVHIADATGRFLLMPHGLFHHQHHRDVPVRNPCQYPALYNPVLHCHV